METISRDNSIFSFHELGNTLKIKSNSLSCEQIFVDTDEGKHRIAPPRCDWALRVYKGRGKETCTFIELKGRNILHACEQLLNSISQFEEIFANFRLAKKSFVISSGDFPRTDVQKVKNIFAHRTKTMLMVRRSGVTENFPL